MVQYVVCAGIVVLIILAVMVMTVTCRAYFAFQNERMRLAEERERERRRKEDFHHGDRVEITDDFYLGKKGTVEEHGWFNQYFVKIDGMKETKMIFGGNMRKIGK